jgi:hypothetical protein
MKQRTIKRKDGRHENYSKLQFLEDNIMYTLQCILNNK